MSLLTRHTRELLGVLHGISHCLHAYDHALGPAYAAKLDPLLRKLEHSVFTACDRAAAKEHLAAIDNLMHTVNGVATKGEHKFFPAASDLLNHYWDLNTIFRESDYKDQTLGYDWQLDVRSKSKG